MQKLSRKILHNLPKKKVTLRVYFAIYNTMYNFHNGNEFKNNALCFDSPSLHCITFPPEALDQVISYLVQEYF